MKCVARQESFQIHTSCRGTTEVYTHCRPCTALQAIQVRPIQDTIPHAREQLGEVGPTKVGARLQLGQRVAIGSHGVQNDVVCGVDVELLGQVRVNLQELDARASRHASRLGRLLLERGQQSLEPLEGGGVLADPEELDTAQTRGGVRAVAQMPNVLENGRPRSDTDTSSDQHRNLILEHILGRGTVWPVDLDRRHLLAVLKGDLVHSHGVDTFVQLSLSRTSTDGVTECACKVADLTNVDRHVRIVRAGCDGERVPLVFGDCRKLDE